MTVRFLSDYPPYRSGGIATLDPSVEAGLVSMNVASSVPAGSGIPASRSTPRGLAGSVAVMRRGREVLTAAAAKVSLQDAWRMPADVIGFRIARESNTTSPTVYDLHRFAVTGNGPGDTPAQAIDSCGSFNTAVQRGAVTWNNGAPGVAVPPCLAANTPGPQTRSDWIWLSAPALAGQMLVVRSRLTSSGSVYPYSSLGFATYADYLSQTRFPSAGWSDTSDRVAGDAAWTGTTSTTATTNLGTMFLEVMLASGAVRVLNVAHFGDSTAQGTVNTGTQAQAPVIAACEALSSTNLLLAANARGWSGVDQKQYLKLFDQQMLDAPPDIVIWQGVSQNDSDVALTTIQGITGYVLKRCADLGRVLIIDTGPPWYGSTLATDNTRKAYIAWAKTLGVVVADRDAVWSDSSSPARYKATYGVGQAHPTTPQAYFDFNGLAFVPSLRQAVAQCGVAI